MLNAVKTFLVSNKIKHRSSKDSSLKKNIDPATGSRFWSMEGRNIQFTWFDVPANTNFPNHKHDSEQVTYVLKGELFFKSQNTVYKISKGDCILIPGKIDHEAWTENIPALAVDAWSPVNNSYTTNNNKQISISHEK